MRALSVITGPDNLLVNVCVLIALNDVKPRPSKTPTLQLLRIAIPWQYCTFRSYGYISKFYSQKDIRNDSDYPRPFIFQLIY